MTLAAASRTFSGLTAVFTFSYIHNFQENEGVVQKALEANGDRFELGHALPSWSHRGNALFPEGWYCHPVHNVCHAVEQLLKF